MGPARMRESLTTTPGIRERPRPLADMRSALRFGVGGKDNPHSAIGFTGRAPQNCFHFRNGILAYPVVNQNQGGVVDISAIASAIGNDRQRNTQFLSIIPKFSESWLGARRGRRALRRRASRM
jgi:hypothetical protein